MITKASIVIPSYNGRELLASYLDSVVREVAAAGEDYEIIVVDDGGTDDTATFLREQYPKVILLTLTRNGGFQRTCNWGARAAKGEIVIFLNNDMAVQPGFLAPLLHHFADEQVFAVSARSLIPLENGMRGNESLTAMSWERGEWRVTYPALADPTFPDDRVIPIAYAFGGAVAVDRRKFLDIGGFDELYAPWTVEDIDLSYRAWKRGWRILYEPASVVHHQHHGTIDRYRLRYRQQIMARNYLLLVWKNITSRQMLTAHLLWLLPKQSWHLLHGRSAYLLGLARAVSRLPRALARRSQERANATVADEVVRATIPSMGGNGKDDIR
jgi:GT2 family glycosyltransferase